MSVTRRTFLAMSAAAGVLAGPALGVARAATAQTKPVRVGYIADYFGTSLTAIASDQEMWAKHGLEPELKVFTNGPIQIQALGAGSLDFGYVGPGALWLPASGKAKLIAMNALGLSDRVIAQAGNNTMADLKGKKIGVQRGSIHDRFAKADLATDSIFDYPLLIMTGEGAFDFSSRSGKVPYGVAEVAAEALRPCVALAGQVLVGSREMRALGIESAYSLVDLVGEERADGVGLDGDAPGRPVTDPNAIPRSRTRSTGVGSTAVTVRIARNRVASGSRA